MRFLKTLFLISLIFCVSSCGDKRKEVSSDAEAALATVTGEIVFTSDLNLGNIEFKIYSDFLKNVTEGNNITNVLNNYIQTDNIINMPSANTLTHPVSLNISNFNYFSEPVNIVCSKDTNSIAFDYFGETVNGSFVRYLYYYSYPNCSVCNGVFIYRDNCLGMFCEVFIQGKADEINIVRPSTDTSLSCEAYDLNNNYVGEYDVILYRDFDEYNVNQTFNFLVQEGKIEGVIGVKKSNTNDTPIYIYTSL